MFWVALAFVALVFFAITFRLANMTNRLEERQEALKQIRAEAHTQKGIILAALKDTHLSTSESVRLWRQYHQVDFEQAKAEVEYVLNYGEKEDHWNYEANKQAAFKHEYEASQWIERASPRDNSPREGMI